ncbi:MAG: low affinity iron permease family protein [Actinomycetota bacterium]
MGLLLALEVSSFGGEVVSDHVGTEGLPTYPFVRSFDTWQLVINTPTTILTFLLVAVLQNSQRRAENAMQKKLDALADGLADLMEHFLDEEDERRRADLSEDVGDLKRAVGLEQRT